MDLHYDTLDVRKYRFKVYINGTLFGCSMLTVSLKRGLLERIDPVRLKAHRIATPTPGQRFEEFLSGETIAKIKVEDGRTGEVFSFDMEALTFEYPECAGRDVPLQRMRGTVHHVQKETI